MELTFIYFLFSLLIAWYIPGNLLVRRVTLSSFQSFVLSVCIGMVLWGWQGVLFGYMHLRSLTYLYLLICLLIWIKYYARSLISIKFPQNIFKNRDYIVVSLIAIGTLFQTIAIWFTGVETNAGLYFCCSNTSDTMWHLALTNEIVRYFPPPEPGLWGVVVQNYHYWSNLVLAELIRVFHLPLMQTVNQYSLVFVSLFLGLTGLVFAELLRISRVFSRWLLFFLYFGGDAIFGLFFILGKGFDFSMSSLEDGVKFLVNPPRAFAIVLFFAGLSFLIIWIRKKNVYPGILMAILFSVGIGFKVYVGLFSLVGLACITLFYLLKKQYKMMLPFAVFCMLGSLVYFPVNRNAGGLYFTGFWVFENFIVQERLGLYRLELARRIFEQSSNALRAFLYDALFMGIYIFAIFGTKLIGIFQTKQSLGLFPRELHIFLISAIVTSSIVGLFFQQTSGGANSFNFLVSVFIIGSIYTALACTYWMSQMKKIFAYVFIIVLVITTTPRVIRETLRNISLLQEKEGTTIAKEELQAFSFLKEKTPEESVVVVDHTGFSLDDSSPYVRLFAERPMYLSGNGILVSHGVQIAKREKIIEEIFQKDEARIKEGIKKSKANYVVAYRSSGVFQDGVPLYARRVFMNEKIEIFYIDHTLLVKI